MQVTASLYALPGGGQAVSYARAAVGTARDAVDRLRGYPQPDLTPPRSLGYVGGGSFHATGSEFLNYFRDLADLIPDDDVLDVGCGNGRMAVPLTSYLNGSARYEGFDVVPAGVNWCQTHITPRHPNFHFQTLDVFNERYRPDGSSQPNAYRFPYEDRSFDFVFATSVFTHLLTDVTRDYLAEVARVLRPGGRLFATFFLTHSRRPVETGTQPVLTFTHGGPGYRAVTRRTPEVAVGYDETDLIGMIESTGMTIGEVRYGTWSGGGGLTFQDVIIARRQP